MTNLTELSCEEFLEKLASEAPTPGGGGAAAMAGAMAGALAAMVANLTLGKDKFVEVEAEVQALCNKADEQRIKLLELVEADAAVFASFMACYKLPKATEEEKKTRLEAIHNAAKKAAGVPMDIARSCASVLEIADRLAMIGNPNVITDATCSAIFARAALRSAFYNVYINLNLTKDELFNKAMLEEIACLDKKAVELEKRVLDTTDRVLA